MVATFNGRLLPADSFVECDAGTLTAAEYVAMEAVRMGVGGEWAVREYCAGLVCGEIESAQVIVIH